MQFLDGAVENCLIEQWALVCRIAAVETLLSSATKLHRPPFSRLSGRILICPASASMPQKIPAISILTKSIILQPLALTDSIPRTVHLGPLRLFVVKKFLLPKKFG